MVEPAETIRHSHKIHYVNKCIHLYIYIYIYICMYISLYNTIYIQYMSIHICQCQSIVVSPITLQ